MHQDEAGQKKHLMRVLDTHSKVLQRVDIAALLHAQHVLPEKQ